MKKFILKSLVFSMIFFGTWVIVFWFTKARQTTNPTASDDWAWMYVTNGNTLTSAKWNNLVNRSAFRAYRWGSSQTIPYNVTTKVNINTEEFDTNNEFDTSTAKFTPKRAGKYFLTFNCSLGSTSDSHLWDWIWWQAYFFKNWTVYAAGTYVTNGSAYGWNVSIVSTVVDANGTSDYFEAYCRHGKSWGANALSWIYSTYFAGYRVE